MSIESVEAIFSDGSGGHSSAGNAPIKSPTGRALLDRLRPATAWRLSGRAQPDAPMQEVPVATQPFTIGRRAENTLSLANSTISGRHAELICVESRLFIKDLNSTNGTFLNGRRINGVEPLRDGDRLQLGTAAFIVQQQRDAPLGATVAANVAADAAAYGEFERLVSDPAVDPYFQPVVRLDGAQLLGYEVFARSKLMGLETPAKMFHMAAELCCEAELSAVLRREGLRRGLGFGPQMPLYLNTHPSEVGTAGLSESLLALREEFPEQTIVLEIHEGAVTGPGVLTRLRAELEGLEIRLAYDDFGAGQARLLELADVPPDVIKFDMTLIRNLHTASPDKIQMVTSLVEMVRRLGAIPLAEGVESAEEAAVCQQVGFELAQGFFFGYPAPPETWLKPRPPAEF